jgi:hypothetical protein
LISVRFCGTYSASLAIPKPFSLSARHLIIILRS